MSDVKRECIQIGSSSAMYVLASDYDVLAAELAEAKRELEKADGSIDRQAEQIDALRAKLIALGVDPDA